MAVQYMTNAINASPTIAAQIADSAFGEGVTVLAGLAGKAVKFTEDGEITPCTTAGEQAIGIVTIDNDAEIKKGDSVSVQIRDNGAAYISADVNPGDELAADADGTFKKAEAGQYVRAVALAKGEANSFVRVMTVNYQLGSALE